MNKHPQDVPQNRIGEMQDLLDRRLVRFAVGNVFGQTFFFDTKPQLSGGVYGICYRATNRGFQSAEWFRDIQYDTWRFWNGTFSSKMFQKNAQICVGVNKNKLYIFAHLKIPFSMLSSSETRVTARDSRTEFVAK